MLLTKSLYTAASCCLLMVSVDLATADDSTSRYVESVPLSLSAVVKSGETRGWEQTRRIFVRFGTNEIAFVVPQSLRADTGSADKVTVSAPDGTFFVSIRVRKNPGGMSGTESVAERAQLLREYTDAKITDEYRSATPQHTGRAYELSWNRTGLPDHLVRAAFVATDSEVVELVLIADASKATDGTFALNSILTTMRKAQDLKNEFRPTNDAS